MVKKLDVNLTVQEALERYPEVRDVLSDFEMTHEMIDRFVDNVGSHLTLKEAANETDFDWDQLKEKFEARGFELVDPDENDHDRDGSAPYENIDPAEIEDRARAEEAQKDHNQDSGRGPNQFDELGLDDIAGGMMGNHNQKQ